MTIADRIPQTAAPLLSRDPLPNSRKVYVEGSDPLIRVPMREISQSPTTAGAGPSAASGLTALGPKEHNPPIVVYDTSGPYTDPAALIDVRRGLEPLRLPWIEARGDVEELDGVLRPSGSLEPEHESLLQESLQRLIDTHGYLSTDASPCAGLSREITVKLPAWLGNIKTVVTSRLVPGTAFGAILPAGYPDDGVAGPARIDSHRHVPNLALSTLVNSENLTIFSALRHGVIHAGDHAGNPTANPSHDATESPGRNQPGSKDQPESVRAHCENPDKSPPPIAADKSSDAEETKRQTCLRMARETATAALASHPDKLQNERMSAAALVALVAHQMDESPLLNCISSWDLAGRLDSEIKALATFSDMMNGRLPGLHQDILPAVRQAAHRAFSLPWAPLRLNVEWLDWGRCGPSRTGTSIVAKSWNAEHRVRRLESAAFQVGRGGMDTFRSMRVYSSSSAVGVALRTVGLSYSPAPWLGHESRRCDHLRPNRHAWFGRQRIQSARPPCRGVPLRRPRRALRATPRHHAVVVGARPGARRCAHGQLVSASVAERDRFRGGAPHAGAGTARGCQRGGVPLPPGRAWIWAGRHQEDDFFRSLIRFAYRANGGPIPLARACSRWSERVICNTVYITKIES